MLKVRKVHMGSQRTLQIVLMPFIWASVIISTVIGTIWLWLVQRLTWGKLTIQGTQWISYKWWPTAVVIGALPRVRVLFLTKDLSSPKIFLSNQIGRAHV